MTGYAVAIPGEEKSPPGGAPDPNAIDEAGVGPTVLVHVDIGDRRVELEQAGNLEMLLQKAIVEHTPAPYWGYLWPSASALAEHLGKHVAVSGKRIIDLGCGLGALGVVCAIRGATVVVADERPESITLARRNAARNGVMVEGRSFDWNQPPADLGMFDAVVASDVLYEDGMLPGVLRFVRRHLAPEGTCYLADPMRVTSVGLAGAARLHGLIVESEVISPGHTMTRGVTLHRLRHRPRAGR